jgi:sulfur carrier protein
VIQLSVNGQVRRVEPGANVARLLEALGSPGSALPWKRTGEIVPRSQYPSTRLSDGDALDRRRRRRGWR